MEVHHRSSASSLKRRQRVARVDQREMAEIPTAERRQTHGTDGYDAERYFQYGPMMRC